MSSRVHLAIIAHSLFDILFVLVKLTHSVYAEYFLLRINFVDFNKTEVNLLKS